MAVDPSFWRGRRVLLTGHTGFKGAWCARWLTLMGAEVTGFALAADDPALCRLIDTGAHSIIGDLRDAAAVRRAVENTDPQIVLHLAAQPLVRASYEDPAGTFATNVQGTAHLLDALRENRPEVVLCVTTDKVYENDESGRAFAEGDRLGGHDPYAASKAAAEIAVRSFALSFYDRVGIPLATARGGNVIGGGDFAEDRLVPDIVRAIRAHAPLVLRNPNATRPWQHVLDCLDGYLTYVQALASDAEAPRALNVGPHDPTDTRTVAELTRAMHDALGAGSGWQQDRSDQPHEMAALALDPTLARTRLGWQGRLSSGDAIRLTAEWYAEWAAGRDVAEITDRQIRAYAEGAT